MARMQKVTMIDFKRHYIQRKGTDYSWWQLGFIVACMYRWSLWETLCPYWPAIWIPDNILARTSLPLRDQWLWILWCIRMWLFIIEGMEGSGVGRNLKSVHFCAEVVLIVSQSSRSSMVAENWACPVRSVVATRITSGYHFSNLKGSEPEWSNPI